MNQYNFQKEIENVLQSISVSEDKLKKQNENIDKKIYISENTLDVLDNLEHDFERLTGLDSLDIKILFLATALQCTRQYLLTNDKGRFETDQKASKTLKKYVSIDLLGPVPYDAFKKYGYEHNTGISGRNHRYTTLGHDPLLGWIFGPMNILTDTVTKKNMLLESYDTILVGNEYRIVRRTDISNVLCNSLQRYNEDSDALLQSILKHAVHLTSDAFTKMGLPIPILNNVIPDLMPKLLNNGIDLYSVSRGMILSEFINFIISVVHGLFYAEEKGITREVYSVKTKKIVMYSNTIASASNIIVTTFLAINGDRKSLTKLDVGGIIVTLHRLVNDAELIRGIKQEFIYEKYESLLLE